MNERTELARPHAELAPGRWAAARAAFDGVLEGGDQPAALEG